MALRVGQSKVLFHADRSSIYPGTESMWGTVLGDNRYELDNVPARIFDISYEDVFEAYVNTSSGMLEFFQVVKRSSNATYRFDFKYANEHPSKFVAQLREISSPKVLHNIEGVYFSINLPVSQYDSVFREFCRVLNCANVLVGCSSEPGTPLIRNEDTPPDALVCHHVLRDRKPVLSIGRFDDGGWDMDCGEGDHSVEQLTMAHSWHVFSRDLTLNDVLDMKPGYGTDRDSLGEPWEDPMVYDIYCRDD